MSQVAFASVKPLPGAECVFKRTDQGYICEARLPTDQVGLGMTAPGIRMRGDIGILFSNEGGQGTQARAYLCDQSPEATIVSDTPSEARLRPAAWGIWEFE